MKTLFISPSYKCNEKCVFCPCSEDSGLYSSLSLSEAVHAVDLAIERMGIEMVLISGGEPTLWKNLPAFVQQIRQRHLKWGMLSNSTTFSSRVFIDRFMQSVGNDFELTTAFHSHLSSEHDRITRLAGSHTKSLQGIRNLLEHGVKVTVKHVINNLTYKSLPQFASWIKESFPASVPVVICNMDICGVAERNRELAGVRFQDSKEYLEKALDILSGERVVRVFNTPLCCIDPYYWRFLQRYESEEQMAALMLPALKDEKPEVRFNLVGDGGASSSVCDSCALQQVCPGTWKRTIEILGEESLRPF